MRRKGNIMDFFNHTLNSTESIIVIVVCVLFILLLLWQARRRSRGIAKSFLEQYPNAAVLYLYVQDLPRNDGKVVCQKGTVSKVFDAKDAPAFGVSHGAACYLVPGFVELDAAVSWTKDLYVARRHNSMQAHFSFQAEPGCGYAAVFDPKSQNAKMIKLEKGTSIK